MTAAMTSPELESYLAAVRAALSDLPAGERDDLLGEVEASLVDAANETDSPIAARLGPPEEFAAELRAAAGLHAPASPPVQRASLADAWAKAAPTVDAMRRIAHDLAPIWWVARAYIAVGAFAFAIDASWSTRYAFVPRLGRPATVIALLAIATIVSVAIGLYTRRHGSAFPRLALAVNLALALAAIPVASEVMRVTSYNPPLAAPPEIPAQLAYDGVPVENIYPYSRDGRLLHDVLLYDAAGRPLDIGGLGDPTRRLLETRAGGPIFNAFPIRYFEPGTTRVADPNAGPRIEPPKIVTPPLPKK